MIHGTDIIHNYNVVTHKDSNTQIEQQDVAVIGYGEFLYII